MKKTILPTNRGFDAVLYINNEPLAGQKNVILNRKANLVSITNQIKKEWEDSLAAIKSWNLICTGMFIKNKEAFDILDSAFINGTPVDVKVTDENKTYYGKALITSFPITANYDDVFIYNIALSGIGELK